MVGGEELKNKSAWRKILSRFFFSGNEKKRIVEWIRKAESGTSAEIRIRVEKRDSKIPVIKQAHRAFCKLGMHKTALKNGVLILLCPNTREFALIGDQGINEKVPENFWQRVVQTMSSNFQKNEFLQGIETALQVIGEDLKRHFPRNVHDQNELSDHVSS